MYFARLHQFYKYLFLLWQNQLTDFPIPSLVLVEQQATAENGEKIVALVNDSATVKTFYKEDGYFRLQPENDEMDPILVNDLQIVGKVIGVLRFLS